LITHKTTSNFVLNELKIILATLKQFGNHQYIFFACIRSKTPHARA